MATSNFVTHDAAHHPAEAFARDGLLPGFGLVHFAKGMLKHLAGSASLLDLETMPDYLKRDIGLLDGRGPRPTDGFNR